MVLDGYLRILGATGVQSCCTLSIFVSYRELSVADIANPDLFACGCRSWISLDDARSYEEQCQTSSGSEWPAFQKTKQIGQPWGQELSIQIPLQFA